VSGVCLLLNDLALRFQVQALVDATYLEGGYAAYTAQTGTRAAQDIAGLGEALDLFQEIGRRRIFCTHWVP
jgi:hypothetical protein